MKVITLNGDHEIDGSFYRDGTVLEVLDTFPELFIKTVVKSSKEVESEGVINAATE